MEIEEIPKCSSCGACCGEGYFWVTEQSQLLQVFMVTGKARSSRVLLPARAF